MQFFVRNRKLQKQCSSFSSTFIIIFALLLGCVKPKTWEIGFIAPMSGDYGGFGQLLFKSAELAVREFHEEYGQIGDREIQLVVKDSMAQVEPAAKAAEELIEKEHIKALIGPTFSVVALALADSFQKAHIPMISGTAGVSGLTDKGDYIFRTISSSSLVSDVQASYLAQELRRPSLAIVHIAENAFSKNLAQGVAGAYEKLDGEVVKNIGLPDNTEDFRPYLEELASLSPTSIYAPLYILDFSQFIKQLRADTRFAETLVLGASGIMDKQLFELAGDTAENTILAANPQNTSYEARYFTALHKVSFGLEPNIFSPYIFDSTIILLNSMRKLYERQKRITRSELRQEIHNARHKGTTGRIEFSKNGDTKRSITIYKIRARQFEQQGIYTIDSGTLQRIQ